MISYAKFTTEVHGEGNFFINHKLNESAKNEK